MKHKIAGFCAVFAALLVSILTPALAGGEPTRVHQHLEAEEKAPCLLSHGEGELCSHLPLLTIDTGGAEIPGAYTGVYVPTEDGSHQVPVYTTGPDGSTRTAASLQVVDNEGAYNHPGDRPALDSGISIRIRGRSSRRFAKNSYAFTLLDEAGEHRPLGLLGMDAHADWVLYGPYLDKTDLRNYLFYNLAGELMDYAPNVRFCEVLLNGEYQGLYLLTERLTAGKDGARLPLEVSKKSQTYTGYLLRLDSNYTAPGVIDSFTTYTLRKGRNSALEIVYPGPANLTGEMQAEICAEFSDFEKALYSFDFNDPGEGYRKYIDVSSFVDAFLLHEMTENYDFGGLSTYLYKGTDGKLRVCVWDFNNSCDNFNTPESSESFRLQDILWYYMLMKDEAFTRQIIARYRLLREGIFSDGYLDAYIDSAAAYLEPAVRRDRERWASTYADNHGLLAGGRSPDSFEAALRQLKDYLHTRLAWMDGNIESLRQYSAPSRVKKYIHNVN